MQPVRIGVIERRPSVREAPGREALLTRRMRPSGIGCRPASKTRQSVRREPPPPCHPRCLREDATNPDLTALERLRLVRGRVVRMREIERELEAMKGSATKLPPDDAC